MCIVIGKWRQMGGVRIDDGKEYLSIYQSISTVLVPNLSIIEMHGVLTYLR